MSETKRPVQVVKSKVELKIPYYIIPLPRKKGEKTIGTNRKGNGVLKKIFDIQELLTLEELNTRLKNAIAILNTGSKAKSDTAKKIDAKLKKEFLIREADLKKAIAAEYEEKIKDLEGVHQEELKAVKIVEIARTCHEVNKAFCESIGDDSQPKWEDAPEWQKESAVNGVEFHLSNPDSKSSDSHDNWLAEKEKDGWKYGEVKDPEKKEHPCMVPYDKLPKDQQTKDALFISVVRSFETPPTPEQESQPVKPTKPPKK